MNWSMKRNAIFLMLFAVTILAAPPTHSQLTISANYFVGGVWHADDGSLYYIRQIGNQIWWAGMSVDSTFGYLDFFKGLRFTNVFQGTISGGHITGSWADAPRGANLGNGTLVLDVVPGTPMTLQKVSQTGGFGPSVWSNSSMAVPITQCSLRPGIRCEYDNVRKNGGSTLYEELKPEKDYVAISGWASGRMATSFPVGWSRTYSNFLRLADGWCDSDGCHEGADADLDFRFTVDRATLDNVPGFWTDGWEYADGPYWVQQKLNANHNVMIAEIIMYGRSDADHPPLLPGWQESNANSTLWNGFPINGSVIGGTGGPTSVGGFSLAPNQRIRVSGVLNLDCGHGITHSCEDLGSLAEIHPVYAVDVVQDWTRRWPNTNLTGTWAGNDMATYYIRQIGNTVWWLDVSRDQGRTFANVFLGTIGTEPINGSLRQVINGNWADIPLGQTAGSGTLKLVGTLCVNGGCNVNMPIAQYNNLGVWSGSGGFGGQGLEKLYDRMPIPSPPMACGVINPGQGIGPNASWSSCDGRFRLSMQGDGNVVLYQSPVTPLWATGTVGSGIGLGYALVMQGDGNLVLYSVAGQGLWASNTAGHPGAWAAIQNDGNLVIYQNNQPIWASNTCCH
jgi:hypothetical protein